MECGAVPDTTGVRALCVPIPVGAAGLAEGLEAGKTKIKYKDVEIGKVESIRLSDDLGQVIVTADLVKDAERYLTENTRFWVMRARSCKTACRFSLSCGKRSRSACNCRSRSKLKSLKPMLW